MQYRQGYNMRGGNPLGPVWSIAMALLFLVALFFIARFIFRILLFLSPVFIIAALIIDHKVVLNYLKWVGDLFKRDTLMGVGATVLSIFGFPVLSAFLLGKALFKRKVKSVEEEYRKRTEGELIDYQEVDSEPLDLKKLEEQARRQQEKMSERRRDTRSDDYEELFD